MSGFPDKKHGKAKGWGRSTIQQRPDKTGTTLTCCDAEDHTLIGYHLAQQRGSTAAVTGRLSGGAGVIQPNRPSGGGAAHLRAPQVFQVSLF